MGRALSRTKSDRLAHARAARTRREVFREEGSRTGLCASAAAFRQSPRGDRRNTTDLTSPGQTAPRHELRADASKARPALQAREARAQDEARVRRRLICAASPPHRCDRSFRRRFCALEAIAACGSCGNPAAIAAAAPTAQVPFDLRHLASVGVSGDPAAAPRSAGRLRASALARASGTTPWPVCCSRAWRAPLMLLFQSSSRRPGRSSSSMSVPPGVAQRTSPCGAPS